VNSGFGCSVIDLALLACLSVDRSDIDDAAEFSLPHPVDHAAAHIEAWPEIRVDHGLPAVLFHAVQCAVSGDTGIVDYNFHRPEIWLDLGDAIFAGVEIRHVDLVDRDAGFLVVFLRRPVIAAVDCGDR
jgi:hypothetical protein